MKKLIYLLVLLPLISYSQKVAIQDAQKDVAQFYDLLQRHSSYYHLDEVSQEVEKAFGLLQTRWPQQDSVEIIHLTLALERIMALIPDRHASVKFKAFDEDQVEIYNFHFPLSIA